ncbi:hypothetical protein VMCG_09644 [Cytospora schulzeri]|uniref:Uncharacterized protein n=1 Tax=Cytospora schulzeri TaxID=448051 RepID=A0A423VEV8_9PEZI|nr:hypothetical protein VMCG_09644 [Valsa malicola]
MARACFGFGNSCQHLDLPPDAEPLPPVLAAEEHLGLEGQAPALVGEVPQDQAEGAVREHVGADVEVAGVAGAEGEGLGGEAVLGDVGGRRVVGGVVIVVVVVVWNCGRSRECGGDGILELGLELELELVVRLRLVWGPANANATGAADAADRDWVVVAWAMALRQVAGVAPDGSLQVMGAIVVVLLIVDCKL